MISATKVRAGALGVLAACSLAVLPQLGQPTQAATPSARSAELARRLAGPDGHVMVVAHRGCWKATSENSLDAIAQCRAMRIDMVELDVRTSRDGVPVLMHDADVARTTDGTGRVADMTLADLRALHLREGMGGTSAATERRIPTLAEALAATGGEVLVNLDAKAVDPAVLLRIVDEAGLRGHVLFKAEASASEIAQHVPFVRDVHFQPILREPGMADDPVAAVASYDALAPVSYEIDVKTQGFLPRLTGALRARCARYWVNSLAGRIYDDHAALEDPDAVWGRLVAYGVDAIQTDHPGILKDYLSRSGLRSFACTPS
ncbi:glycerophosphodiester phosphodiesterase family protein [Novosphingobium mangrovi (ex Hu et al. 2023)]|uniref:Glycerophosphodiester phosphodiesterase family protein n=1 Tax=Novosphingobium mangrovi (ex Hu et al. 2023) TaxID=2930094 RepID=A0ABT0ADP5_9SPHN|nr:glycerophosphodiester phosphodiesterase family protein [Novosphingobium mangrovi (ex Hu et al. 2023)]MCJ1961315.1 glycerophosphodiester phosphodiesterase family protein [Novosphingobium mangrovi (ex Hu et al. 2023)]